MNSKNHIRTIMRRGCMAAIFVMIAGIAAAAIPYHMEEYPIDSRQPSPHASEGPEGEIMYLVNLPGAPWLRVKIAEYNLAPASYISFTSLLDGGVQRQYARTLPEWGNLSAFLNGDAVVVQLHRGPGGDNDYFVIGVIMAGEVYNAFKSGSDVTGDWPELSSQCGTTDDRVPSAEARPARLTFVSNVTGNPINACTAWPAMNGAMLSAGHCVDFDPDGFGAGLPDGVLDIDANDVIEFNPPNSTAGGNLVFANPDDQYTMDLTSFTFDYDGEGNSTGLDWAVFGCNRNPNTNLTPHQAQGFYRMTNGDPAAADTIRISGYGTDNTPNSTRNQIQQTHTGPYVSEVVNGTRISHTYQVDTTGGNSGSPIIWETNGYTLGIHTNAGCNTTAPIGANSGTSFEHNPLENALNAFPGANSRFVDKFRFGATEDGTVFHAWDTVAEGVSDVPSGGRLNIVAGTYAENMIINKPMFIRAPVGGVLIGD